MCGVRKIGRGDEKETGSGGSDERKEVEVVKMREVMEEKVEKEEVKE